jgi:hypothetical protein
MIKLKARELDVYVNDTLVGSVTDCGDCWRIWVRGRRKRRGYNLDFDTRRQAVRGLVQIATAPPR